MVLVRRSSSLSQPLRESRLVASRHWAVSHGSLGLALLVFSRQVSAQLLFSLTRPLVADRLVFVLTVAVGVQARPASAPQEGPWTSDWKVVNNPSFTEGIAALSSLVFAFSGTPGFFSIVSEMRDPQLYTRSLAYCQATVTIVYITIGTVVYIYCGSYVASPALGSAGDLMKKVCYGLALPGLLVTETLVLHVSRPMAIYEASKR